jgi:formiminotetrahydrofolate cyclodeaminase
MLDDESVVAAMKQQAGKVAAAGEAALDEAVANAER